MFVFIGVGRDSGQCSSGSARPYSTGNWHTVSMPKAAQIWTWTTLGVMPEAFGTAAPSAGTAAPSARFRAAVQLPIDACVLAHDPDVVARLLERDSLREDLRITVFGECAPAFDAVRAGVVRRDRIDHASIVLADLVGEEARAESQV